MAEYGFKLEKAIADRAVPIIVGYANGDVGYICTATSYKEGGYGPETSRLKPETEAILLRELERLADLVLADSFEAIDRRPKKSDVATSLPARRPHGRWQPSGKNGPVQLPPCPMS